MYKSNCIYMGTHWMRVASVQYSLWPWQIWNHTLIQCPHNWSSFWVSFPAFLCWQDEDNDSVGWAKVPKTCMTCSQKTQVRAKPGLQCCGPPLVFDERKPSVGIWWTQVLPLCTLTTKRTNLTFLKHCHVHYGVIVSLFLYLVSWSV